MKIKVLLFGILMSESGKQEVEVENVNTVTELKEKLMKDFPGFAGYQYQVFVNHKQILGNATFKQNDEIALIPPFAGG